jgi:penicillin-binding protein 2
LVSHPTYDLNEFERLYRSLSVDELARPLMNRATQFALEPGSTVKPLVGLAALSEGLITPQSTIECTGYLVLDGVRYRWGRCWTMSMFERTHQSGTAPHPTGHLTYADAIERSCNVFFETLGDRLGIEGLRRELQRFGLGRRVGIGLPEAIGRLPDPNDPAQRGRRGVAWFAAIGQDQIAATPLQIANAVATIARRGVWMRPTIIPRDDPQPPVPDGDDRGTVLDLKLPDGAIAAAVEGMTRVVNSPAGTGLSIRRDDLLIAGKTGSAQAARLTVARRGSDGQLERNERGGLVRDVIPAGKRSAPNPVAPWYRYTGKDEDELTHAWFVGFFPADDPKIAFAVFVEYGGSGGTAAGSVASLLIDACIEHGYVQRKAVAR